MTREEAIGALVAARLVFDFSGVNAPEYTEAMKLAISALTPPTQEQMERVWPGCELCNGARSVSGIAYSSGPVDENHDFSVSWSDDGCDCDFDHCPHCGRPLTPEAWEELRKRWEALHGE